MIYQVYSVKDLKAEAFAPPFFLTNNHVAKRTFVSALADPTHPMHRYPEDYELHRVGEFADDTGGLTALPESELVLAGTKELANGQG